MWITDFLQIFFHGNYIYYFRNLCYSGITKIIKYKISQTKNILKRQVQKRSASIYHSISCFLMRTLGIHVAIQFEFYINSSQILNEFNRMLKWVLRTKLNIKDFWNAEVSMIQNTEYFVHKYLKCRIFIQASILILTK